MATNTWRRFLALLAALAVLAAACGSSDSDSASGGVDDASESESSTEASGSEEPTSDDEATSDGAATSETTSEDGVVRVPEDHETIQAAVDAAEPGDLVLIGPGTYEEAVEVTTDDLVIRGMDRNEVILEGNFELTNGFRVLGADGVAIENMTAQNYTGNGFFWTTEIDGYRASHLTAIRNGDYGIYAFGARNGLIKDSYASGSPDASFYIGQCYPCNAVIDNVVGEWSGLGYSGTNSGGDLYIVNSTFRNNRAGIVPNSGNYEGCAPSRGTVVVGNIVYSNSNAETSAIGAAKLAQGNGIVVAGATDTIVERNLVWDHDIAGVAVVPFPEDNPIAPIPEEPLTDCLGQAEPEPGYEEAQILWPAERNSVQGNVISDSREADMILVALDGEHANCFQGNTFETTLVDGLEDKVPCEGETTPVGPEATVRFLQIIEEERPESVPFADVVLPDPGPQESMEDPENAPAEPAGQPDYPDVAAIALPEQPADA